MKPGFVLFLLLFCLPAFSACGAPTTVEPPPASPAAQEQPPQAPPEPTLAPPSPVPTSVIDAAPTPENRLFRDDFSGGLLEGWRWENENPGKWSIVDGWLQIVGEDGFILDGGENKQANMLWREVPEGDYAVTVHVIAKPDTNFQQAAIFLYEDGENFIVINRGFCGHCGGNGVYMDYRIQGSTGNYKILTEETAVYLRLESVGEVISGYYAFQPDQWERLGRFGNYFAFRQVGLGVSNVDPFGADSDVVGMYDYFELTRR